MEKLFTIVIPNYNTWDLVAKAVNSVLKFDQQYVAQIIVVDDCSPIVNYLQFPEIVTIVRNEKNLHYTKTVNKGLKYAESPYIMVLDSDACFTRPILGDIIAVFKTNNKIGCVGINTTDDHGASHKNYITEPSILSLISGQQLHRILRPLKISTSRNIIPFSCAVFFTKQCLEELHYLDEDFYYLDADTDLCMRIHLSKQFQLIYLEHISVYHVGGNSINKNSKRVLEFYKSRWQLLEKHNKLHFQTIAKLLILMRISIEYFLLLLATGFSFNNQRVIGRKELFFQINRF